MQQAAGHAAVIRRRGDGKPEVVGEPRLAVSAAHSGDSTLAVAGSAPLGCDLELGLPVRFRHGESCSARSVSTWPSSWRRRSARSWVPAATPFWTAGEALKKASVAPGAPQLFALVLARGWVELRSGSLRVFSVVLSTRRREGRLAIAVLTEGAMPAYEARARGRLRGDQRGRQRVLRQPHSLAGAVPGDVSALLCSSSVLQEIQRGLCLVTARCSCEYLAELVAFDEIAVRMRLGALVQNRLALRFEYARSKGGREELVARGEQEVVCMRREGGGLVATPIPGGAAGGAAGTGTLKKREGAVDFWKTRTARGARESASQSTGS